MEVQMGNQLWKVTDSVPFGNGKLVNFLLEHGASLEGKPALEVPASAFRAALDSPEEAGLTEADIAFIKAELSGPRVDGSDADDEEEDDEEPIPVDIYDLW
jgi:hypothetical protein